MAKVYVFLADGFEDVEALIPVDVLRRGGVEVVTVSVMEENMLVESAHGVQMMADALVDSAHSTMPTCCCCRVACQGPVTYMNVRVCARQ